MVAGEATTGNNRPHHLCEFVPNCVEWGGCDWDWDGLCVCAWKIFFSNADRCVRYVLCVFD